MAASAQDILRLRRMCAEPDDTTYNDAALAAYIEAWPALDAEGRSSDETNWTPVYDLHAAAADMWTEKAASYHAKYNFSADDSTYNASQIHANAMEQARYHRARMKPTTKRVIVPKPDMLSDIYLGIYANIDPPED